MEKLSAKKKTTKALSVAARHLSQGERQVWTARKIKKFAPASQLSLRESWHLQAND